MKKLILLSVLMLALVSFSCKKKEAVVEPAATETTQEVMVDNATVDNATVETVTDNTTDNVTPASK